MTDATMAPAKATLSDRWRSVRAWARKRAVSLYALALSILLAMLAIAPQVVVEVPAGSVGVIWLRFFGGTVTDRVLPEGMHAIFPWDKATIYDARLTSFVRQYEAVAKDGLAIKVELALRYRINPAAAGLLHKLAGPDYMATLVQPEIASLLYQYVSRYEPDEFYAQSRKSIQDYIKQEAKTNFPVGNDWDRAGNPLSMELIHVDEVLVSNVTLPDTVRAAIERKAQQDQALQEYEFRLAREKKEAERKAIEADGIRAFQDIVAKTITNEYLRLRGIEATEALAGSNNSKMVVIGGQNGLPLILNTADDNKPTEAPAPVTGGSATSTSSPAARGLVPAAVAPPAVATPAAAPTPAPIAP